MSLRICTSLLRITVAPNTIVSIGVGCGVVGAGATGAARAFWFQWHYWR